MKQGAIRRVISCIQEDKLGINGINDAIASLELALRIKSMIV